MLEALLAAKAAGLSDLCGPAQTKLLQTHIDPSGRRQYACAHLRPMIQLINETLVCELLQMPTGLQSNKKEKKTLHTGKKKKI